MEFDLSCKDTLDTVAALLDTRSSELTSSVVQLEAAFWHLRTCLPCRKSLTEREHGRFVCEVALIRD